MPFIPAVNTARVTLNQRLHDQVVNTTYHVRKATPWSVETLNSLIDEVIDWWNDDLAPNLGVGFELVSVAAKDLTVIDSFAVEKQAPPGSGGDIANPLMPGNVALVIKHVTGFSGRNKQGRTFQGGLVENQQENNEVTLAVRNAFVLAYEALRGRMVAMDAEMVVASFYDGMVLELQPNGETIRVPVPRATALLTPVLSFVADTFIDAQRRRLHGRGV